VFLYAAVTGNPVTIIIFVLFEVLPSLALLYYLRPYDWKRPFSTAKNSSGTTGKSSNKGTGLSPLSTGKLENYTSTSSMDNDSARSPKPHVAIQTVTTPEQIADATAKSSSAASSSSDGSKSGRDFKSANDEEQYPISSDESQSSENEQENDV
jgi:hypothetical protein